MPRMGDPPTDDPTLSAGLLAVALGLSTGLGLVAIGWGVSVMNSDAQTHGESLDGLGVIVGAVTVAFGTVWSAVHGSLAVWLWRAWRGGRRLTGLGAVSVIVGGTLLWLVPSAGRWLWPAWCSCRPPPARWCC
jgi:hypothetical protein